MSSIDQSWPSQVINASPISQSLSHGIIGANFLFRSLSMGFIFADACYTATHDIWWKSIFIGDPHYRPFGAVKKPDREPPVFTQHRIPRAVSFPLS